MPTSSARGLGWGFLLTGAGLWLACAPSPPRTPLQVEYAGCTEVFLPGPVCALGRARQLRLWIDPPPESAIEVRADGRALRIARAEVEGGQQVTFEVPPGAAAIEVRARAPQREAVWSLPVTEPPWPPLNGEAYALWQKGRRAEALRLLEARIPGLPFQEKWPALRLRAQIAVNGGSGQAVAFSEEAVAAERAAGALRSEAYDATALVWIHIQARRFDAARKVLSGLRLPPGAPADAVYYRSFYSGLLAEDSGDARSALAELKKAVSQAKRVGLDAEAWAAEQVLARQLQALGRSREAAARFADLRRSPPPGLSPCDWAEMLANQAWSLLLAREAGESAGDPVPVLQEARRSYETARCPRLEEKLLNLRLNLTLAHLQAGRPAAARAALPEAGDLDRSASPLLRLWSLELEARLDLAEGRPHEALELYERLEELAASALSPDSRWQAAYGQARSYRALGRFDEALAAFRRAESLLDGQSLRIPIQEGRETFAAQREGATNLFLEMLLAHGRAAEAFEVARRSRSRVLRQLARGDRLAHLSAAELTRWNRALGEYRRQRDDLDADIAAHLAEDWKLPADRLSRVRAEREARFRATERALDRAFAVLGEPREPAGLAPPRLGEVVLAYHPLPAGWAAFAADGRTVAVYRFQLPQGVLARPRELGDRLLAPFHSQIERAQRVRVLPYGILREVDFHALPFGGDILLAARPVVYGLDLADLAAPAASPPRPGRRALIVADPLRDLPAAEVEAGEVRAALERQRPAWTAVTLQGTAASAEAVRRGLAGADLLHYAGHGAFSGFGGWESVLPLAGGTRLTLGDLLALDGAPPRVVLSGCETARSGAEAPVEGLSLAHAFLLAGSRSVIAATRPVGDHAAEGLFTDLYRSWGATSDLAVLLQQAELAWRWRDPGADWSSFRLFEP